jgi:hypothetical protein
MAANTAADVSGAGLIVEKMASRAVGLARVITASPDVLGRAHAHGSRLAPRKRPKTFKQTRANNTAGK